MWFSCPSGSPSKRKSDVQGRTNKPLPDLGRSAWLAPNPNKNAVLCTGIEKKKKTRLYRRLTDLHESALTRALSTASSLVHLFYPGSLLGWMISGHWSSALTRRDETKKKKSVFSCGL